MVDPVGIVGGSIVLIFACMFFILGMGGITGNLPPPPHFSIVSIGFGMVCILISIFFGNISIRIFEGKGPLYD